MKVSYKLKGKPTRLSVMDLPFGTLAQTTNNLIVQRVKGGYIYLQGDGHLFDGVCTNPKVEYVLQPGYSVTLTVE